MSLMEEMSSLLLSVNQELILHKNATVDFLIALL